MRSVMASIVLPASAVPPWARHLSEADWLPTLAFTDATNGRVAAGTSVPPTNMRGEGANAHTDAAR